MGYAKIIHSLHLVLMFGQLDLSYSHKSIAPSSTRFHSSNIQSSASLFRFVEDNREMLDIVLHCRLRSAHHTSPKLLSFKV